MPYDDQYLLENFSSEILELLSTIKAAGVENAGFHETFNALDEYIFFYLLMKPSALPGELLRLLPDWPPDNVRRQSTADVPLITSMLEAAHFWTIIRRTAEKYLAKPMSQLRVADYGAGWGRIARFAAKDIPTGNLIAFEPNPVFCDYFKACRVPGTLVQTDWPSSASLTGHGIFDVIYSFSILTHSSDGLTKRIKDRWIEISKPGSLIFATVRPRFFLNGGQGDASFFKPEDRELNFGLYDSGQIVYHRYEEGSGDWGVTVLSPEYMRSVFGPEFRVVGNVPLPTTPNQMMVILERT